MRGSSTKAVIKSNRGRKGVLKKKKVFKRELNPKVKLTRSVHEPQVFKKKNKAPQSAGKLFGELGMVQTPSLKGGAARIANAGERKERSGVYVHVKTFGSEQGSRRGRWGQEALMVWKDYFLEQRLKSKEERKKEGRGEKKAAKDRPSYGAKPCRNQKDDIICPREVQALKVSSGGGWGKKGGGCHAAWWV